MQNVKEHLDYSYWSILCSDFNKIKGKITDAFIAEFVKMPISSFENLDGKERYWLKSYLQVKETIGKCTFDLSNYISQKAKCIPDKRVRK